MFFFQLATGGIESAVYRKLIAPFENDLPATLSDGFSRVCAEQNYAYFGINNFHTNISLFFPCQLVSLPDTSYRVPWAFIIPKNSSYKGLINWRWDNKMKSIRYITDNSQLLLVPRKSLKTVGLVCLLLVTKDLTTGMYECFNIFQNELLAAGCQGKWYDKIYLTAGGYPPCGSCLVKHTNNTGNVSKQTIQRTQKYIELHKTYIE